MARNNNAPEVLHDRPPAEIPLERPIITTYYRGKALIRMNSAKWVNNAVLNCIQHMQVNDYGATVAEIVDSRNGVLHAVITHNVVGKINILYKREVHKDEQEYSK